MSVMRQISHRWTGLRTIAVVIGLLLFVVPVGLDLPRPHVDDQFYTGSAISLAQGRGNINPLLSEYQQLYATPKFFEYPPLHVQMLGAWLSVWGCSTKSMISFQSLGLALGFLALCSIATVFGSSWAVFLAMVALFAEYLSSGLRPDIWGLASLVFGASLLVHGYSTGGYFSLFMAPLLSPHLFFVAVAGAVVNLVIHWQKSEPRCTEVGRKLRLVILPPVVGAGIALAVLLIITDGQLAEFAAALNKHSSLNRTGSPAAELNRLLVRMTFGQEALLTLPLVLMTLAGLGWLASRRGSAGAFKAVVGFFLTASAANVLYAARSFSLLLTIAVVLFALGLDDAIKAHSEVRLLKLTRGGLLGLLILHQVPLQVGTWLPERPLPGIEERVLGTVEKISTQSDWKITRLIIDERVARYVFDYRIPTNALSASFCRKRWAFFPAAQRVEEIPADELWVLSAPNWPLNFQDEVHHIRFLNRTWNSIIENQNEVRVFSARGPVRTDLQ